MTVDTVLIAQSSESFGASSRQQFYVFCSRGRTAIRIYTDSVAELFQVVCRSDQQPSAGDLMLATAAPVHQPEIQPSRKKTAASASQRRALQTALTTVQDGRDHLHIASDRGTVVVVSDRTDIRQISVQVLLLNGRRQSWPYAPRVSHSLKGGELIIWFTEHCVTVRGRHLEEADKGLRLQSLVALKENGVRRQEMLGEPEIPEDQPAIDSIKIEVREKS